MSRRINILNMKKIVFFFSLFLLSIYLFSQEEVKIKDGRTIIINNDRTWNYKQSSTANYTFTDSRDGKTYKTVIIGTQTWMAENLNYSTGNSWCYDNSSSNCNTYGRLYDWNTARRACPSGWRLPSKSDFETLLSNVGGNAYHKLKDGGSSGFSALFGGWRSNDGNVYNVGFTGLWWSSSERGASGAWGLYMGSLTQSVLMYYRSKELGFCVRCLQD